MSETKKYGQDEDEDSYAGSVVVSDVHNGGYSGEVVRDDMAERSR